MGALKRPEGARAIGGDQRRAQRDDPPLGANAPASTRKEGQRTHRPGSPTRRRVDRRQTGRAAADCGKEILSAMGSHCHCRGPASHSCASSIIQRSSTTSNPAAGPASADPANPLVESRAQPSSVSDTEGMRLIFSDDCRFPTTLMSGGRLCPGEAFSGDACFSCAMGAIFALRNRPPMAVGAARTRGLPRPIGDGYTARSEFGHGLSHGGRSQLRSQLARRSHPRPAAPMTLHAPRRSSFREACAEL